MLLVSAFSLLQQGCTVKWQVVNNPDPYPNATRIEQRVKNQVYRITSSFNAGNLGQDMADGLVENGEIREVRSMAYVPNTGPLPSKPRTLIPARPSIWIPS